MADKDNKPSQSVLDAFSRHPLFITSFTLIIGSGIFAYLNDKRKSNEYKREKAIETVETIDKNFHSIYKKMTDFAFHNFDSIYLYSDEELSDSRSKSIDSAMSEIEGNIDLLNSQRFKFKLYFGDDQYLKDLAEVDIEYLKLTMQYRSLLYNKRGQKKFINDSRVLKRNWNIKSLHKKPRDIYEERLLVIYARYSMIIDGINEEIFSSSII
jgi:hypothetical protein